MHLYRITLELRSGLGTPLAADTLWGHIAWGIRYREGEAALTQWLARYEQNVSPPLVLSDPLPAGFWPRPTLPPARLDQPPDVATAVKLKSAAKGEWINHDQWTRLIEANAQGLGPETLQTAVARQLEAEAEPPSAVNASVVRIGVNRFSGGTLQPGGGALFTSEQTYHDDRAPASGRPRRLPRFDVWALSPEPETTVTWWFEDAIAGGYGRDASAGLGELEVVGVEPGSLPAPPDANAAVLLGPAVPRPVDPARGFFSFDVRSGRLGGDFAIAPGMQRQKRPLRCLQRGTVLLTESPPSWIGRLVGGVHEDRRIRHYGLAPLLPCRLSPEILEHPLLHTTREGQAP